MHVLFVSELCQEGIIISLLQPGLRMKLSPGRTVFPLVQIKDAGKNEQR